MGKRFSTLGLLGAALGAGQSAHGGRSRAAGRRGEGGNNVRRALSLAARGRLRCAELVTHRFPLAGIAEAFRVLQDRDGDPVKVVVMP